MQINNLALMFENRGILLTYKDLSAVQFKKDADKKVSR